MFRNHEKGLIPNLSLKMSQDISLRFGGEKSYLLTPRMKKILRRDGMFTIKIVCENS